MTKFAKTILFLIIIIILFIGGFLYLRKSPVDNTNVPTQVSTSSIKGCYVAKLAKDVYILSIDSQSNENVSGMLAYNNYEKDSSSGTFSGTFKDNILLGNYSFQSEGMDSIRQVIFKKVGDNFVQGFGPAKTVGDKEVFEDTAAVTYDSKSTFIKVDNCTEHFTDSNKTFTFDYNASFIANMGDKVPTTDWRINTIDKGMLLGRVTIPRGYMPQTNFGDAKFTVGLSTDAKVIKSCTDTKGIINEENKGGIVTQVKIDGYPFIKFTTGDAGAGNFYETTSYRGIVDGDCYAIEYTIHSTSIGAYDPSQGVKEFNKSKIQDEFEKIIKSFKFLIDSN